MSIQKIALVSMPVALLNAPSLGLEQLKSNADNLFKNKISIDVFYFSQPFCDFIGGIDNYQSMRTSESRLCGLTDWFFRIAAFPYAEDNTEDYFNFLSDGHKNSYDFLLKIHNKREHIDKFMDNLICSNNLDKYNVVGFSTMSDQLIPSLALAKKLKRLNPSVMIIFGGASCESPMGNELLSLVDQIDYVFSGRSLDTFNNFIELLLKKQVDKADSISNVIPKKNPKKQIITEKQIITKDIFPDYSKFIRSYRKRFPLQEKPPILLFETSFGCWWGQKKQCSFCGLNGDNIAFQELEPEDAVRQVNNIIKENYPECKIFLASDLIMPKSYIKKVIPYVSVPEDVYVFYEVRANLKLNELETLSKYGIKYIQPGIESLFTNTLKLMNKGLTPFSNVKFLKNCVIAKLKPMWNILIGFPGENEEDVKGYIDMLPALFHLPPPTAAFNIMFHRYSCYFNNQSTYKINLKPFSFYEYVFPANNEKLANLAYFFYDSNKSPEYLHGSNKYKKQVDIIIEDWNNRWLSENCFPELYIEIDSADFKVIDSRKTKTVEYKISDIDYSILKYISNVSRKKEDIQRKFDNVSNVEDRLCIFKQKKFLLEENGKLLNLVFFKRRYFPEERARYQIPWR